MLTPIPPKLRPAPLIQAKFSLVGEAAKSRVFNITGESGDPFDGNLYRHWLPTLTRIGFNRDIVSHIKANARQDTGGWITCAYCQFEYPPDRITIDHIEDWAAYSARMTTASSIWGAMAVEVYIGCNDPNNLIAACKPCNSSKGDRPATLTWIQERRRLANKQDGF